jgi:sigma-E factor negative regulatory protein RseB
VEPRSRQALGAPCPGTDPAALRLITAAVLAGLVISGVVVISRHDPAPGGTARLSHAGEQALAGGPAKAAAPLSAVLAPPSFTLRAPRARRLTAEPALRLLSRAAAASRTVAYEGVEVVDGWGQPGRAGATTTVLQVWHTPGTVTLTQAVAPVPAWSGEVPHILLPALSVAGQTLAGATMLEMSHRLAMLLSANYRVMAVGWGQVAGRSARIVTARWPGGRLAARFWLDRATTLPLRRQTFDAAGQVLSDAAFAEVRLGATVGEGMPAVAARPWGEALAAAQLAALRAQGWPLPGPLPGNLALLGARQVVTPVGRVIDLDYSDGLSVVSVFVQRGHLPARLNGWSEVMLHGRHVYADDSYGEGIAWSARGFVYTVVAAAPADTLGQVVAALPCDGSPGFFTRLGRGLRRLWSWLSLAGW